MQNIDKYDDEIKDIKRTEIKPNFNFKSMYMVINRVVDEKGEYDAHYPKDGFILLWVCAMIVLFILFIFSHSLLMVATVPFIFFYGLVISKIFKAFKEFEYKRGLLGLATFALLAIEFVGAYYIQMMIF